MTQNYLVGEMSVLLAELHQATVGDKLAGDFACLRRQAEDGPLSGLGSVARQALALADRSCWHSLLQGDTAAFLRCVELTGGLSDFVACARLLDSPMRSAGD